MFNYHHILKPTLIVSNLVPKNSYLEVTSCFFENQKPCCHFPKCLALVTIYHPLKHNYSSILPRHFKANHLDLLVINNGGCILNHLTEPQFIEFCNGPIQPNFWIEVKEDRLYHVLNQSLTPMVQRYDYVRKIQWWRCDMGKDIWFSLLPKRGRMLLMVLEYGHIYMSWSANHSSKYGSWLLSEYYNKLWSLWLESDHNHHIEMVATRTLLDCRR